jgi:hypothetical protein
MSEVKKIYRALVNIADGLRKEGIAKGKKCSGGGNFAYRGIDDVYAAVSPLLASNSVIIRPVTIERLEDVQAGKMRLVRINVQYEAISAEDGSSVTFAGIGEGCDTSDKAAGKALSYAYKTALFQLFAIPVSGQDDPDSVVHKIDESFIPEATMRKANQLEAEIVNCFSKDDLQAMVKDIMALGLPADNETLKRLRKVWSAQKKTIEEQVNNI